ncbi:hypothetical protein QVD17_17768 [Tagetes erecta]|uniref:Uncharacterized protein n=1 Tax=Tagetes erecta TaxID=13708 RepID=A0AAD8P0J7_TARER|nr:hypothetical protein QVD17_17768 [Tagetes erecta]
MVVSSQQVATVELAKCGCGVIASASRTDRLKVLCVEINNSNVDENKSEAINRRVLAVVVELDVDANGPTIDASVRKAWEAFGRIDVLINNARIIVTSQNSLDWSEKDWDKAFSTNLKGAWLVSKHVCLQMYAFKQAGSIVNISSVFDLQHTYSSSKSALNTMTKSEIKIKRCVHVCLCTKWFLRSWCRHEVVVIYMVTCSKSSIRRSKYQSR